MGWRERVPGDSKGGIEAGKVKPGEVTLRLSRDKGIQQTLAGREGRREGAVGCPG